MIFWEKKNLLKLNKRNFFFLENKQRNPKIGFLYFKESGFFFTKKKIWFLGFCLKNNRIANKNKESGSLVDCRSPTKSGGKQ